MKNKTFIIITACVAGLICIPLSASAAGKKKAASSPAPEASASASPAASPAKSPRPLPFQGTVSAVDQTAKTFTVGKRVFKVIDQTEMTKAGQPATMADITENVKVTGSYRKQEDGSLEVKMVKVGAMAEKKEAGEKKETGKKKENSSESPAPSPKP
jgi:hypothetical protein